MPLKKASSSSKKAINKAVSANIRELYHNGKKARSMKQIIAISETAARGRRSKKK
jgi:hypothetical protein